MKLMPPYKKRRQKRSNKNFVAIPFDASITLGTLAAGGVIATDIFGTVLGEDLFVLSIDGLWSSQGHTSGEGPIHVGFAHDDYTGPEIAENLGAELTDPDDKIAQERSRRLVRKSGVFMQDAATPQTLNHGTSIRNKLKFSVGDGHNVSAWALNNSGATLTTGTVIRIVGTLYGRWQR